MRHIPLFESKANEIRQALSDAGYSQKTRKMGVQYSRKRGDSTFIHHSLNIIRASKNSEGQSIVTKFLGAPNGIASEGHEQRKDSWFLNGYSGKAGTKIS